MHVLLLFESGRCWVGSDEAEGFWVSPNEMCVDSWEDLRSLGRFWRYRELVGSRILQDRHPFTEENTEA